MIQFIGVSFTREEVTVSVLDRNLERGPRTSSRIANVKDDAPAEDGTVSGAASVIAAEWTRAASFALQETYVEIPPKERKIWGLSFSGPTGWIALDHDFEPLGPMRLTPAASTLADLGKWLEDNPRLGARVAIILSPKDYFRFVISRSLSIDLSTCAAMGAARIDECDWNLEALAEHEIERRHLPPVFEPTATTGRLDEEGMRKTGLPGSLWLTAGTQPFEAALVDAADFRTGSLWAPDGADRIVYGVRAPLDAGKVPAGWRVIPSPYNEHRLLEREAPSSADEARAELEAAGHEVSSTVTDPGDASLGTAALAAIGSGLVRSWDLFYKKRPARDD